MNVIAFTRRVRENVWSDTEINRLADVIGRAGGGLSWETGVTENGDVQFYVLGPLPDQACELCVSRIGGRYVLEDGAGRLMVAHHSLAVVVTHVSRAVCKTRWRFAAPIVMMWAAVRSAFHDRIEPLMVESEEAVLHFAPQFAAFV